MSFGTHRGQQRSPEQHDHGVIQFTLHAQVTIGSSSPLQAKLHGLRHASLPLEKNRCLRSIIRFA